MGDVTKKDGELESLNDLPEPEYLETLGVLIDSSGSMAGPYPGKHSRHDAADDAMNALWEKNSWELCNLMVWSFSSSVEAVICDIYDKPVIPRLCDGTDFAGALSAALAKEKLTRIILTSDGEDQYPTNQVSQCQRRGIPVDTIFIGSPGGTGETCLRMISEATGGQFCTAENAEQLTQAFEALETSERLQIGYDPDEPIEL
jgi:uncharacterized protein with von Willebrand factor type A (vWA) domain